MSEEAPAPVGVTHRSLRDTIADDLRERIISGRFPPGQRLVERDLAAEMQVSRIPLREAFLQLEAEGLVQVQRRRGVVVASLSRKDVTNLFDVRESLESLAARLAAERADERAVQRLHAILVEAKTATGNHDADGIARANAAFHAAIVDIADNELLHSMMAPMNNRLRWLFRLTSATDPKFLCDAHTEIYEAIAARDPDRAARIAFEHIAATRLPTFVQLPND